MTKEQYNKYYELTKMLEKRELFLKFLNKDERSLEICGFSISKNDSDFIRKVMIARINDKVFAIKKMIEEL